MKLKQRSATSGRSLKGSADLYGAALRRRVRAHVEAAVTVAITLISVMAQANDEQGEEAWSASEEQGTSQADVLTAFGASSESPPPTQEPESETRSQDSESAQAMSLNEEGETAWSRLGDWERTWIESQLGEDALRVSEHPWGRRICEVSVISAEVFGDDDIWPLWLNSVHAVSKERVIRRIAAVEGGDTFDTLTLRDAERRLLEEGVLGVARLIPLESDEPDCIDVVVATRDVWSLTLNGYLESAGSTISNLTLSGTESNVLGTHSLLSADFVLTPGSWELGPTWLGRFGRLRVYEGARAIWQRGGELEGYSQRFDVFAPVSSDRDPWAGRFSSLFESRVRRSFVDGELNLWDDPNTEAEEEVPDQWRQSEVVVHAELTRSFLGRLRHELTFGNRVASVDTVVLDAEANAAGVGADALSSFENLRMPRTEIGVGPVLGYAIRNPRYFTLRGYETYGVAEERRRGASSSARLWFREPTIGADERALHTDWLGVYAQPLGSGGFIQVQQRAEGRTVLEQQRGYVDLLLESRLDWSSPRFSAGRLVVNASWLTRPENRARALEELGGNAGVRGYGIGALRGEDRFEAHAEFRSRAWNVGGMLLGGVVFVEAASAHASGEAWVPMPATGLGLRLVMPQFSTYVRGFDIALPLRSLDGSFEVGAPLPSFAVGHFF